MTAAIRTFFIEQGATFGQGFNWYHAGVPDIDGNPTVGDPYWTDPTGIESAMQIRKTVKATAVIVEASTYNGKIVLSADGRIDLRLEDTDTDLLTIPAAYYDWEVRFPDGTVRRILEGPVTVDLNTTRNEDTTP